MSDLTDLLKITDDQDAGRWVTITHPLTGEPTSLRFRIAGPDSLRQVEARAHMAASRYRTARLSAVMVEAAAINFVARCVLDWEVTEGGQPIPFSMAQVERVVRASPVIRAQLERALDDRLPWILAHKEAPDVAA